MARQRKAYLLIELEPDELPPHLAEIIHQEPVPLNTRPWWPTEAQRREQRRIAFVS